MLRIHLNVCACLHTLIILSTISAVSVQCDEISDVLCRREAGLTEYKVVSCRHWNIHPTFLRKNMHTQLQLQASYLPVGKFCHTYIRAKWPQFVHLCPGLKVYKRGIKLSQYSQQWLLALSETSHIKLEQTYLLYQDAHHYQNYLWHPENR